MTLGLAKTSFMSMKMSSSRTSPSEGPLPLTGQRREVVPLETVRDSNEALAVSMKHHLLDLVSIGILLVGFGSSPKQSK